MNGHTTQWEAYDQREPDMDEARAEWMQESAAEDKWIEEHTCEKCGGETSEKSVGDETYKRCSDCGHIDLK